MSCQHLQWSTSTIADAGALVLRQGQASSRPACGTLAQTGWNVMLNAVRARQLRSKQCRAAGCTPLRFIVAETPNNITGNKYLKLQRKVCCAVLCCAVPCRAMLFRAAWHGVMCCTSLCCALLCTPYPSICVHTLRH